MVIRTLRKTIEKCTRNTDIKPGEPQGTSAPQQSCISVPFRLWISISRTSMTREWGDIVPILRLHSEMNGICKICSKLQRNLLKNSKRNAKLIFWKANVWRSGLDTKLPLNA